MIKYYNGYQIPKLGLGTFRMNDESETYNAVLAAIKIGYRHFDTAQMYQNEEIIGKALKDSGLRREEFFITTKLQDHHLPAESKKLILESMRKLNVDYIDQLLIHWPYFDDEVNLQTWRVFEELYDEGLVKVIGVSNFTRYQLELLIKNAKIKPMVNQVEMHPGLTQVPLRNYCKKNQIQITSYGPLMRGMIFEEPFFTKMDKIAKKHQTTVAVIAIAWGLSQGVLMIPKSVNENRLKENFSALNIKLSDLEINEINNLNIGKRVYTDPSNNPHAKYI